MADSDRRSAARKPFVARMFFHDNNQLYEGICRDISIGGMQVLVADYPGNVGDEISLNVHPENSEQHFVASGKIVRMLDKGQGFSFRFTVIETDAIKAIQKYISAE
ncbi:MAG: PilZ domain-containing protein [Bacteriovoracaceae bacterium]|nr:PilZ domain-containing protein [Bacteriovoracaceae bacterium]